MTKTNHGINKKEEISPAKGVETMNVRNVGLRSNRGRIRKRPVSSLFHLNRTTTLVVVISLTLLLLFQWSRRQRNGSVSISNHPVGKYSFNRRHWSIHNGPSASDSILYAQKNQYAHRIAILLPYTTSPNDSSMASILSYFTVFCYGAAGTADRIDFFIFHTGIFAATNGTSTLECPPNVIFVNLESHIGLAKYLIRVVDGKYDQDTGDNLSKNKPAAMKRDELLDLIASFVKVNPYGLVEFKPALGHIFQEYIVNYTHWGYSDFDIVFGDVNRWITDDELIDFDLVTYTFGDQQRLYMRGQFTFHKNLPATINQLWRACTYLSDMDVRFEQIVQKTQKYHVESAEGCYSAVLMEQRSISIKFAVKAWTDIYTDDTANTHGIAVSLNRETGRQVLYKLSPDTHNSGDFDRLRSSWFEKKDNVYIEHMKVGLQRLVGERLPIEDPFEKISDGESIATKPCMYWALPTYQSKLCLKQDIVSSNDVVYWINGTLYKQKFENVVLSHSDVITMPLFHFQEWKRSYRYGQLASMHMSTPIETFILAREGAIPMISEAAKDKVKNGESFVSPLSMSSMKSWMAVLNDDRSQLPVLTYCIQSSIDGSRKNARCDTVGSWQDHLYTKILVPAPGWASHVIAEKDVTLILTLQLSSWSEHPNPYKLHDVVDHLQMTINRWYGKPCVVIFSIPASLEESTVQYLQGKFDITTNPDLSNCLIALVIHPHGEVVISSKALMNMAIDAVPTRWYISGLDLERGLSISLDTSFFAHRTAASYSTVIGNVFLIPQFAIANDTKTSPFGQEVDPIEHRKVEDSTLDELLLSKRNHNVFHPSELSSDCVKIEKLDPLFHRIDDAWLSETLHTVGLATSDGSLDEVLTKRIGVLEDLQLDILEMAHAATDGVDEYSHLYSYDESPILLTDNLGPHQNIRTNEIVREIEEFTGQRCFNAVRLTQMVILGYTLNVLPVAFASSSPRSRKIFDHTSETTDIARTCTAMCFNFEEEEFWILAKIATTEMKRAAKSAVIWAESLGWKPAVALDE
jgi:hypothetical protein